LRPIGTPIPVPGRIGKRGFPVPDSGRVGNRGFPSPFPGQIGNRGNGNWGFPGLTESEGMPTRTLESFIFKLPVPLSGRNSGLVTQLHTADSECSGPAASFPWKAQALGVLSSCVHCQCQWHSLSWQLLKLGLGARAVVPKPWERFRVPTRNPNHEISGPDSESQS